MLVTDFVRNIKVDAATATVDGGTVEMRDASDVVILTYTLQATAFAAASGGTAAMNSVSSEVAGNSGTVSKAVFIDSSSNERFTMAVPDEISISPTNTISAGQVVAFTSCQYSQPAGSI